MAEVQMPRSSNLWQRLDRSHPRHTISQSVYTLSSACCSVISGTTHDTTDTRQSVTILLHYSPYTMYDVSSLDETKLV